MTLKARNTIASDIRDFKGAGGRMGGRSVASVEDLLVTFNDSKANIVEVAGAPDADDDGVGTGGNGYFNEGDIFVDTAANTAYICVDNATGAAIWIASPSAAASASASGVVELATDAETITGTDATRAVTPAGLQAKVASTTAKGIVEIATAAETTTGTDADRVVSPDGLAGSIHAIKEYHLTVIAAGSNVTTGDGKIYFQTPVSLAGYNLVNVRAGVGAPSSGGSGTVDVQIHNITQAADILSTKITIDVDERSSATAAAAAVINAAEDDITDGDMLRIDVDAATSTSIPTGLFVTLGFQLP
jgi:hypothetical protein